MEKIDFLKRVEVYTTLLGVTFQNQCFS